MDRAEAAKWHRCQAEECRAKADLVCDKETRAHYLGLAAAFDGLADNKERMAVILRFPAHGRQQNKAS
jgi:hypothetical protein